MKKALRLALVIGLMVGPLAFAGGTNNEDPDPGFTVPLIFDIFA